MGFEYGFSRKLDVVRTRPVDWETPRFDLSPFIAEINHMKATSRVLREEGPQVRLSTPDAGVLVLLRRSRDGTGCALGLVNLETKGQDVDLAALLAVAEPPVPPVFDEISLGRPGGPGNACRWGRWR